MASISVTYTFTNGSVADATQVSQNFTDLVNGLSDATKDLSIGTLIVAGTTALNGNTTLGNATGDTITYTGRVASNVDPSAAATYLLGSATLPWLGLHVNNGATDGGAIYFDGSATKFIKANAAGTQLEMSGLTTLLLSSMTLTGLTGYTGTGTMSHDGGAVFNESGADVDFRIEGDTVSNVFVVDASTDNIGFFVSAPNNKVHFQAQSSTEYFQIGGSEVDNAMHALLIITDGQGNPCGSLDYNGNLNTSQLTTSSDRDMKTNFSDYNGLDLIKKMESKQFEFKSSLGVKHIGCIAQQMMDVFPQVVRRGIPDKKIPWGIGYAGLTPPLIKAVQELSDILDNISNRIEKLESN